MRRLGWVVAWPGGVLVGAVSVTIAWRHPDYAFADSALAVAAEALSGCVLITFGLIWARRRPASAFGALLAAGGAAWFLLEWNDPAVGSSLVFTVGLVLYTAAFPLLAHALLVYPSRRLSWPERGIVVTGYVAAVCGLGVLPALVYDPAREGCALCPHNLLLTHASNGLYAGFNHAGIDVAIVWSVLAVALLVRRLIRSSVAMRIVLAPMMGAGVLYLLCVAADLAVSAHRGYLSNDHIDRVLWLGQGAAVGLIGAALVWSVVRPHRIRGRLARLVLDLSSAAAPGGLETALGHELGDPGLRLAYAVDIDRYVDGDGRVVDSAGAWTVLVRDDVEVARLRHKRGLQEDDGLIEALTRVAGLGLDNERLRAERLAHLADLRESRARIVAAGDQARQRLERDLHDGAQQHLVALKLQLALARVQLRVGEPDRSLLAQLDEADETLTAALDDLRILARGLFPAVLAEEGLAAAVEALAEDESGRIQIGGLPAQRLTPDVESAAYRVIVEAVAQTTSGRVAVTGHAEHGRLVVEVHSNRVPQDLSGLQDRVGALDGTIALVRGPDGAAMLRTEIPCAS
jgi:signal transduction histidine kinase